MPAVIIIPGGGKKKGASMPPPEPPGKRSARQPAGMPPPSLDDLASPPDSASGAGANLSPAEVGYAADDLCSDCANAQGENCSKYQFPVSPNGHCTAGFEPQGGESDGAGDGADDESQDSGSPWDQAA